MSSAINNSFPLSRHSAHAMFYFFSYPFSNPETIPQVHFPPPSHTPSSTPLLVARKVGCSGTHIGVCKEPQLHFKFWACSLSKGLQRRWDGILPFFHLDTILADSGFDLTSLSFSFSPSLLFIWLRSGQSFSFC